MNEWADSPLGNVATLQRGFDLPSRRRRRGNVPIVSSAGVSGWHDSAIVKSPGVVTGRYGTIGEVFFQNIDFWPLNTTLWVSNFHGNDEKFVYYLLQRINFATHSGKSGVPGVNRNDLHAEMVRIPISTDEQRRVATALSNVDALISTLEQMLTKKRAFRRGVMQQLLTGRTRLPGFVDWRPNVALQDVVKRFSGYWGSTPGELDVDVRIIRAGDVSGNNLITGFATRSLSKAQAAKASCRPGDVILTTSGTIGNVALIQNKNLAASNFVRVLRPGPHLEGRFLYYALQSSKAKAVMAAHLSVSAMPNLGSGFFRDPFLQLPSLEEQRAISEVLSTIDAEIKLLDERRRKSQKIKTGMMQQLLSGPTRLEAVVDA